MIESDALPDVSGNELSKMADIRRSDDDIWMFDAVSQGGQNHVCIEHDGPAHG